MDLFFEIGFVQGQLNERQRILDLFKEEAKMQKKMKLVGDVRINWLFKKVNLLEVVGLLEKTKDVKE